MWKDWAILARERIKKWEKFEKWANYYWMNYLDKEYQSKIPWKLIELITFSKPKREARVEVYDNCICFDVRTRYEKEKRFINVDWNDEEIIERVKMTKWKTIGILWAVSFVLWLWYEFVEDKHYDEEIMEEKIEEVKNTTPSVSPKPEQLKQATLF